MLLHTTYNEELQTVSGTPHKRAPNTLGTRTLSLSFPSKLSMQSFATNCQNTQSRFKQMGNDLGKLYAQPPSSPLEFQYRIQMAALKQLRANQRLDAAADAIAKATEADLRARFVSDIATWTSIKSRPFEPLPFPDSVPDADGVFARGLNCEVRASTIEGAGKGLFAVRRIKKGSIIEFFDGRVVATDAVRKWQKESNSFCSHCIALERNLWTMDCSGVPPSAVQELKGASFANSQSQKRSNAQVRERVKNLTIVKFLVAKQDIQPGDEIVYNYALGV
jgi:hypothetical protein